MGTRTRHELILVFLLLSLVSLSLTMRQDSEPEWPRLLQQPANLDPVYAALQQRADMALQRMVQSDPFWE